MSQYSSKLTKCPHPVGAFSGISIDGKKVVAGALNCNSRSCPHCGPILKKKLFARIIKGVMGDKDVPRFGRKFLTLTYGGETKRADSSPQQAYEEMAIAFHNTIKALRHRYGSFHYFRVCELHQDGWPHFHVMLVGETIAPKSLLAHIEHYWREQNGMGFVRLNCIDFKDGKHAANYMLKYITKDLKAVGKGKRVFTASVGALLRVVKKQWLSTMIHLGPLDPFCEPSVVYDFGDRVLFVDGYSPPVLNLGDRVRELSGHAELMQQEAFRRVTQGAIIKPRPKPEPDYTDSVPF